MSPSALSPSTVQLLPNSRRASASAGQTPFTIVTTVAPERVQRLATYLNQVGADLDNTAEIRFRDYPSLHFCSLQILDDPTGPDAPLLVFEGNIDGNTEDFFALLTARDLRFLQTVYAACPGFPDQASAAQVCSYLLANDRGANAFYVGQPGAVRLQIERDSALRARLEAEIERRSSEFAGQSPDECRAKLVSYVDSQPDLAWVRQPIQVLFHVRFGKLIFGGIMACVLAVPVNLLLLAILPSIDAIVRIAAAASLGALTATIVAYLIWLRYREKHDRQDDTIPTVEYVDDLRMHEDVVPQNHLVSVTDVKPGWLRLLTLRVVLFFINQLARYIATQGDLGGIVTIHFARWVILKPPGASRPRLLFLSNYDGSFENYLGEFIDQASAGLTAVWSNTQLAAERGFPNTQWLFLRGGSRDEQRFKNYARLSQQVGGIWFTAYPTLSMKQITNNREIRAGLIDPGVNATDWLRRF